MTLGLILADLGERKLEEDRPRNCQKVDLCVCVSGGVDFIEIKMWQTKSNGPVKIEYYSMKMRCKWCVWKLYWAASPSKKCFIQYLRAPQNSFAINVLFSSDIPLEILTHGKKNKKTDEWFHCTPTLLPSGISSRGQSAELSSPALNALVKWMPSPTEEVVSGLG